MMNSRFIVFLALFFKLLCVEQAGCNTLSLENNKKFLESFIRYYDISTVGRYTHEYHPFLFEKSSYSLDEMEGKLTSKGFDIKGRIVLTGYEEQAIPSYFTNYRICTGARINDEVRVKSDGGWTGQLHNKFGVMTGYLFRNVSLVNEIHAKNGEKILFDHINRDVMSIYNPKSYIFQRHAFGRMLPFMQRKEPRFCKSLLYQDSKGIFRELIGFWRKIYENELRFGNRKVLGTQDVLFSIAHAEHLLRSDIPLFKYYVGPDITYPIKVTKLQKEAATFNAQTFVKKFVKHLVAIDGKETVYIFCSFVDGVGKSTLLGNVQNFQKHGIDFVGYDPVDNSSSQLAQLYDCGNNVFIADLPAQMSHFTYKPDGMVYFDVQAAEDDEYFLEELYYFAMDNKEQLTANYNDLVREVEKSIFDKGFFEKSLCDSEQPERAFVKNVLLLNKKFSNKWVPFKYCGEHYLFHASRGSVRKLVKLECADSIGLKNAETEQMLFFDGVRFPLPYDFFVDDLINQFKDRNIKNIVFVNFLSMYPRSSRENIRVNYVLQQLALLYKDFSLDKSFYGAFTGDAHLLHSLKTDSNNKILYAFRREAFLRLCLYNMMEDASLRTVEGIPLSDVTKLLKGRLDSLSSELTKDITKLTAKKVDEETKLLERVHGKTRNYINIQSLNFDHVIEFGKELQKVFSNRVKNDRLKELWKEPGKLRGKFEEFEGEVNQKVTLSDGTSAQLLFIISPHCKDEAVLAPVVRCIRASWYTALSNLIGGTTSSSNVITVEKERFLIPPIWVRKTEDGKIAVFRRVFEMNIRSRKDKKEVEEDKNIIDVLNISRRIGLRWGFFTGKRSKEEKPYFLSMDRAQTNLKFFAFGYAGTDFTERWPGLGYMVTSFVYDEQHKNNGAADIISTEQLWKGLQKNCWWKYTQKSILEKAQENHKNKEKEAKKNKNEDGANKSETKKQPKKEDKPKKPEERILLGQKEHIKSTKLAIRALATLDFILKDPYGDIAIVDDKDSFVAALKLFEKVTLPTYFDLFFEKDLFKNYSNVKKFIKMREGIKKP